MRKINGGIIFVGFSMLLTSGALHHFGSSVSNSIFPAGQAVLIADGDPAPPFPKPPQTVESRTMADGDPAPPFPKPPRGV